MTYWHIAVTILKSLKRYLKIAADLTATKHRKIHARHRPFSTKLHALYTFGTNDNFPIDIYVKITETFPGASSTMGTYKFVTSVLRGTYYLKYCPPEESPRRRKAREKACEKRLSIRIQQAYASFRLLQNGTCHPQQQKFS